MNKPVKLSSYQHNLVCLDETKCNKRRMKMKIYVSYNSLPIILNYTNSVSTLQGRMPPVGIPTIYKILIVIHKIKLGIDI